MDRIRLRIVSPREWSILTDLYGYGKVKSLGDYDALNPLAYPGHDIAQGIVSINGRNYLSETGFLRLGAMSVFGSVARLPSVPPRM